jgi:hypothetical protein
LSGDRAEPFEPHSLRLKASISRRQPAPEPTKHTATARVRSPSFAAISHPSLWLSIVPSPRRARLVVTAGGQRRRPDGRIGAAIRRSGLSLFLDWL